MAISRVPGYSLLANLDRQGTDLSLTSSGQTLQYWDVTNYRVGINNQAPRQELDVSGNIITSNGHVLTNANLAYDIGSTTNWWRNVYAGTVNSNNLSGTLLTNAQPNITSVGNLSVLNVTGNLSVDGNLIVNGISVGNLSANTITADVFGNLTGYVLQNNQPYITSLSNITVNTITILSGNLDIGGNVYFDYVNANVMLQGGNQVLDTDTNIQISGDTVGYGNAANIYVELTTTGVGAGTYGADGVLVQFSVDNKGRILSAANVAFNTIGNLTFSNTTISSTTDLTISTTTNGNIYLDAGGTGVVQIVGQDAVGLPVGDNSNRPANPAIGYLRFNTETIDIEYWNGTTWTTPAAGVISSDTINPDGVANAFVLSSNSSTLGVMVSINGTLQQPYTSYTIINNNQIQFTEIPLTTDTVEVRHIVPGTQTVSAEALTLGTTAVILDTANVNITGNVLPSANVTYSLGSETLQWKDLWVSGNSIYIGGSALTVANGQLSISGNIVGSAITYSNVNVKAYTETMGFQNYSNVNVAAYTTTQSYTNYSNVNVAAYITSYTGNVGGTLSNASQPYITALGTISSGTWAAGTIGVLYGGTGATTATGALTNLLPSGASTGYVLTTGGSGSYYWATGSGGGGSTVGQTINTLRQSNIATQGQTVFTLTGNISYTPGTGQLGVYINGVRQFPTEYVETASNVFTLTTGINAGDVVFAEINSSQSFNNYANLTYASNVGNIAASGLTVQSAIESLENNKSPLSNPVFSGVTTIGGNLVVQGNLFVNGNLTTINANNLTISDSMIYLADDNPADTLDIGIVSAFTSAVRYQHTGFVRDATDGDWKLFANVVAEPTTTIDFTNASYSNLQVGNLRTIGTVNASGNVLASTGAFGTVTTSGNIAVSGNVVFSGWSIRETGTKLYFAYNGVNKMSLDTGGNLVVTGDLTAFGTIT
jgi:hypothetical protein